MTDFNDLPDSPFGTLRTDVARMRRSGLSHTIDDVDKVIEMLEAARAQIAEGTHRTDMTMMTLHGQVKNQCDAMTENLKLVTKAQKAFGKSLDKALPERDIPMESDAMSNQSLLINRAINMHLLREGNFTAASTFLEETGQPTQSTALDSSLSSKAALDSDGDNDMDASETQAENRNLLSTSASNDDFSNSENLQNMFGVMYTILQHIRRRELQPAITWARRNASILEAKGSHLEFELCKLQYVWLFKGSQINNLPDDENNGQLGALKYARENLVTFQGRHPKEIQQLAAAMVYGPNIASSPYASIFEINSAFEDVALTFTREFCSCLGLSAESPLYVAVTAGAIALPRLIKYTTYMKEKKTEWTTENELAFETPLPKSMIYHPIFVCPVSKEQTTEENPPMLIPCGHVISSESLGMIAKGIRFKCPYCPEEGMVKDARKITF